MTEIKVGDRVRYNRAVRNGFELTGDTGTIVFVVPEDEYAKDPFFGRIRWDKPSNWDDLVYRDEIELLND